MSLKRVALTGGIATGKSYVLARLAAAGIPTLDADTLAREAVAPGTDGLAAVVGRFGPEVLDGTGALNRAALAQLVFSDEAARRDLEGIIHPRVRAATDAWLVGLESDKHAVAVVAIPLLFETGREADFDAVVVTSCTPETQLRRLMARDHLSEDDARRRIAAQLPLAEKVRRADYVINTDTTFEATERAVVSLIREW